MSDELETILRNTVEVVSQEELEALLAEKGERSAYVGFEPSGLAHVGLKILASKVNDLASQNFKVTILLADWHAYINDKLGGDIGDIRACGRYMEECFRALGVDEGRVRFLYASDMIGDPRYWERVLRVAKNSSLQRIRRSMTIMGRKGEEGDTDSSKFIYPSMQVADIFELGVDVAYGGMDQRKAHMLARDVADKLGWRKPIALHTPLISGLRGGERMDPLEAKMSKSDPGSSISLHDTEKEIKEKLKRAYCPEGELEGNPVIEICRHIVFQDFGEMVIERPEKWGGNMTFGGYDELAEAFTSGQLHPADLKGGTAAYLAKGLEPVKRHFESRPEILEGMRAIQEKYRG